MTTQSLNGDQAMAYGALAGGVKVVTSYPGSPSSGTVEMLIGSALKHEIYVEWSANEKVAMEIGIGASMTGRRALVCTKSVGLNVMIDPLMALNLTPVHGGLVILLGDDPGAYGSQNDQDSRPLALHMEMLMLEPSSPAEAYAMMHEAFILSEKHHTAVIIRETRSFTQQSMPVEIPDGPYPQPDLGVVREPYRFVPVPINAVAKHRALHATLKAIIPWAEKTAYNRILGAGRKGVVGVGFASRKILDILDGEPPDSFRLLKLGVLYPLPRKIIADFLRESEEVLVVEENGPFIESQLKALAHELGSSAKILGKQGGYLPDEGEVFRWRIQNALSQWLPEFIPKKTFLKENEDDEKPTKRSFCGGCRYEEVLDKLEEASKGFGQNPFLIGDPGCLVTVADRLDAKYAMGSAVGVADGVSKAGCKERAVAIFGDSAFFHTALPAVCNAVHNRSRILMIILDNKATSASGFQPNPGVGRNALGQNAPALDIERIVRACGVKSIFTSNLDDTAPPLAEVFRNALNSSGLTLVVVRIDKKTHRAL